MEDTLIVDYLKKLSECSNAEDATYVRMLEGRQEVTLDQVAYAIRVVVNQLADYIEESNEAAQKLQEMRLIAILEELPEDIQERVRQKFLEVDDDLLNDDNEGDNQNDKQ
ncbi:hypothetical protein 010DV004_163 [Bacillus phage 010DV004]|nr:hypothetical protein 010DV004_163 [Bacillus phage 010DV004]QZA69380.1 hypothetical protein 010DV005_163 [Bacillus phage 010DV005]